MTVDPLVALESLGYTRREAAFLYLVAIHSGYFLRRQFDYFIDRNRGGIVSRFLEKTRIAGHVQFLDSAHGRQVYHLFSKPIYRIAGNADSQNRRVKGDGDVRARLMKLDYVLENDKEHYLASDQAKSRFLAETRGIDCRLFLTAAGTILPAIRFMPVSVVEPARPAASLVRLPFIDEGLRTVAKFERVLATIVPVLKAIGHFELVYVATSDHNFREASALFWKEFSAPADSQQMPLDRDWRRVPARPAPLPLRPEFVTLLLRFHYPSLQRNELTCSAQCSAARTMEGE